MESLNKLNRNEDQQLIRTIGSRSRSFGLTGWHPVATAFKRRASTFRGLALLIV